MTATGSPCSGTSRRGGRRGGGEGRGEGGRGEGGEMQLEGVCGKLVKKEWGGRKIATLYHEEIKGPPNRSAIKAYCRTHRTTDWAEIGEILSAKEANLPKEDL